MLPRRHRCRRATVLRAVCEGSLHEAAQGHTAAANTANAVRLALRCLGAQAYHAAFLGMENAAYCAWITNPTTWGGGIELAILAAHYRHGHGACALLRLRQ